MMKRFVCMLLALSFGAAALYAQESHAGTAYVSLKGGPAFNLYENAFSYRENGRLAELFTFGGSVAFGFDFSDPFGIRVEASYGGDAGACNVRQTSAGGFWPYTFKHGDAFVDAVLNLNGLAGKVTRFRPKLYAGLGGAYTFGFTDSGHPWQKVNDKNLVFGCRAGFIAEYTTKSGFGFFADLCGEAYNDNYNGLMPNKEEQKTYEGYGGFPLDLRGLLSVGIVFHFL